MRRVACVLTCVLIAVAFVGCDKQKEAGEEGSGVPGAEGSKVTLPGSGGPAGEGAKAPAGLPDTKEAMEAAEEKAKEATEAVKEKAEEATEAVKESVEAAEKQTEEATGAVKETAEKAQEAATETATEAKEAVAKTMEELEKVAESTFSLEKLKEVLGSLSGDNLTKVADNLLGALKDQQGIVKGLQDKIANLGIAEALKATELKNQLQAALSLVEGLKGKLSAVVTSLKGKGLDVSKYTEALSG